MNQMILMTPLIPVTHLQVKIIQEILMSNMNHVSTVISQLASCCRLLPMRASCFPFSKCNSGIVLCWERLQCGFILLMLKVRFCLLMPEVIRQRCVSSKQGSSCIVLMLEVSFYLFMPEVIRQRCFQQAGNLLYSPFTLSSYGYIATFASTEAN